MTTLDYLTCDEFARAATTPGNDVYSVMREFSVYKFNFDIGGLAELHRPFLSETAWAMFFAYRALRGRVVWALGDVVSSGKLEDWRKDSHTRRLLVELISAEELVAVDASPMAGLTEPSRIIERHICEALRRFLSGREDSADDLMHVQRLVSAAMASKRSEDAQRRVSS